ncbi:MAG: hypothetical protein OXQ92_13960, partial [Boseongicola sp.]|nr:hypothetical protein [Boseongicola sp.]
MNTFQWFWYDLKFGVEEILAAEGLSEILFAIQMFALVDLLPFFLVMSLTFVLCIGCSALVTGIVFSFLPMRFHAWLDGM